MATRNYIFAVITLFIGMTYGVPVPHGAVSKLLVLLCMVAYSVSKSEICTHIIHDNFSFEVI